MIVTAYVVSTLLVLLWLTYTIHTTLQENREDAEGAADQRRTSELIRVIPVYAWNLWLQTLLITLCAVQACLKPLSSSPTQLSHFLHCHCAVTNLV